MRYLDGAGRLLLTGLLAFAAGAAPAQDFSEVEIRTVPVAGSLHMLIGRGGNIGVSLGDDGVFLIDDQYAPLTEKIRAAVRELHAGPIRFVLNTHWHGDHTGGNENLGRTGTVIVAHDNVRERMSVKQVIPARDREVPPAAPGALPVITFSEAVTFHLNGDELHVFHVSPAHTDGDSIVHFRRANAIHAGDVYFNGFYPYIDVATGGSIRGLIAATQRILELADDATRIIPGHGPLSSRAEVVEYRRMLVTVNERVGAAIRAGQGADELVAAKPLADLDPVWGDGFMKPEAFLRIVHADLSRSQR